MELCRNVDNPLLWLFQMSSQHVMCHQPEMMNKKLSASCGYSKTQLGGFLQFSCQQLGFLGILLQSMELFVTLNDGQTSLCFQRFFLGFSMEQETSSTKLPSLHWRSCHNLSWVKLSETGYDLLAFTFTTGWWLTYPSEKYDSQLGWWHSQYMGK